MRLQDHLKKMRNGPESYRDASSSFLPAGSKSSCSPGTGPHAEHMRETRLEYPKILNMSHAARILSQLQISLKMYAPSKWKRHIFLSVPDTQKILGNTRKQRTPLQIRQVLGEIKILNIFTKN